MREYTISDGIYLATKVAKAKEWSLYFRRVRRYKKMKSLTEKLNDAVGNAREIYEAKKDGSDDEFRWEIEKRYENVLGEAHHEAKEGNFELDYLVGKLKEYDPHTDWLGWRDNKGKTGFILNYSNKEDIRREDIKEIWRNFAKYVKHIEKAKRLIEDYPFLKEDKEEERRIVNRGRINIYRRIEGIIPYLEENGFYKELSVLREIADFIEEGRV